MGACDVAVVVVVVASVVVVDMVVVDVIIGAEFGSDTVGLTSPHAHKTPHSSPQTHKQAIHRFFFNIFSATFPLIHWFLHLHYTVNGEGCKEIFGKPISARFTGRIPTTARGRCRGCSPPAATRSGTSAHPSGRTADFSILHAAASATDVRTAPRQSIRTPSRPRVRPVSRGQTA